MSQIVTGSKWKSLLRSLLLGYLVIGRGNVIIACVRPEIAFDFIESLREDLPSWKFSKGRLSCDLRCPTELSSIAYLPVKRLFIMGQAPSLIVVLDPDMFTPDENSVISSLIKNKQYASAVIQLST